MKKRILLFSAAAGIAVISLTSGKNGAGAESGYNATGAETGLSNPVGCSVTGASCHGTAGSPTTGITLALELDSAGVPTTHYKHGMTYTVKITGTNTTANNLPNFGFQVTCIKGSVSMVTPVNAGTFASTGLPANVQYTPAHLTPTAWFACNLVEHSNPITATTGSGGTGSTYVESFQWTAPVAGTGTISFWGALNAVDGDLHAGPTDHWNTNHIVISEWPTPTAVAQVTNPLEFTVFPNPASNLLNINVTNAQPGNYTLHVFDMTGRCVAESVFPVNGAAQHTINSTTWAVGIYQVVIEKDGNRQVIPVVKQ